MLNEEATIRIKATVSESVCARHAAIWGRRRLRVSTKHRLKKCGRGEMGDYKRAEKAETTQMSSGPNSLSML